MHVTVMLDNPPKDYFKVFKLAADDYINPKQLWFAFTQNMVSKPELISFDMS